MAGDKQLNYNDKFMAFKLAFVPTVNLMKERGGHYYSVEKMKHIMPLHIIPLRTGSHFEFQKYDKDNATISICNPRNPKIGQYID